MNLTPEQQAIAKDEIKKYEYVWENCNTYGDKHHDLDLFNRLNKLDGINTNEMIECIPEVNASVIVLGCGDGALVRHLDYLEYKTMGVDIFAHPFWSRALDRTGDKNTSFTHRTFQQQCLWEKLPRLEVGVNWDSFFCADVLEHIPEILLNEVLVNISNACNSGVFQIANMGSSFAGLNLHPIKEDAPWWLDRIYDVMGGKVRLVDDPGAPKSRFVIYWTES